MAIRLPLIEPINYSKFMARLCLETQQNGGIWDRLEVTEGAEFDLREQKQSVSEIEFH